MKILVAGYSVRHIACSGNRAGYKIVAADAFGDVDLRRCACAYMPLAEFLKILKMRHASHPCLRDVDAIILSSGVESASVAIEASPLRGKRLLCNDGEKMKRVSNKLWLARALEDMGVPHPKTFNKEEIEEKLKTGAHLRFPIVVKPIFGGGGLENFFCLRESELRRFVSSANSQNFIFQEFVKGKHTSVSVISSKSSSLSISVNEQLLGMPELGARRPFLYCGNISPLDERRLGRATAKMEELAEEIVKRLGLIGSNGVDFVSSEKEDFVIEVNPRFQGSLDTVELAFDVNVFDAHVKAFDGRIYLDEKELAPKRYAARLIVFAERDVKVERSLDVHGVVDIPEVGREIKKETPIASALSAGRTRAEALSRAIRVVKFIKSCVSPLR
ncbi:MAG TPA: ATP-grasp domain-containing protein [Methanomicrobia archaeon]|nr:ATP-grasp domain-containing protein [Methanomicrobia archaeon]HEX58685.1 ATP-grasp domain-containing protein [Methanomicrobia archaeon]